MNRSGTSVAVVFLIVVVAVGGLGAFLSVYQGGLGKNQTVVGSSTTTTTTTTSSSSSSVTGSSNSTQGSFYASSSSPVRVLSVEALTWVSANGTKSLTFRVTFENVGNESIHVLGGCSSCLTANIPSGSIIETIRGGTRCLCASALLPISPGQSYAATTPGCWSGYSYRLLEPGDVKVYFDISWSYGGAQGGSTTTVVADFVF